MSDRRRIHGPSTCTSPPSLLDTLCASSSRQRPENGFRGMFLKTGITPSASGSAYIEVESPARSNGSSAGNGMKISCTVHGPRALPRSAPFSHQLLLTTHVKFAPFATTHRWNYVRDPNERDLSIQLETALRGVVIADRWPKSGVDIILTIIEGDQSRLDNLDTGAPGLDLMTVLSSCITVASAALIDAGIDCVDVVSAGVAAAVGSASTDDLSVITDPVGAEHKTLLAVCCVAYLPARDEITNIWFKGELPSSNTDLYAKLVSRAVHAAQVTNATLISCLNEEAG